MALLTNFRQAYFNAIWSAGSWVHTLIGPWKIYYLWAKIFKTMSLNARYFVTFVCKGLCRFIFVVSLETLALVLITRIFLQGSSFAAEI